MGGSHEMPCESFLSSYLVSLSDCQLEWSPGVLPGAVFCVGDHSQRPGKHLQDCT